MWANHRFFEDSSFEISKLSQGLFITSIQKNYEKQIYFFFIMGKIVSWVFHFKNSIMQ